MYIDFCKTDGEYIKIHCYVIRCVFMRKNGCFSHTTLRKSKKQVLFFFALLLLPIICVSEKNKRSRHAL